MGIFIDLLISKAVTKKEWQAVYEETLQLIKHIPFAENRMTKIHGINTYCLVPTCEREETYGWNGEKTRIGWNTNGDYTYMAAAEEYYLPRELVKEGEVDENAGDAMLGALPAYMSYDWNEERFSHVYHQWGAKTQGEPYHIYLLSVAALIEARLGPKAFTYGDITRGQFKRAVEIANQYLENPIEMPDRCYMDRLLQRVKKLSFTEEEQLAIFEEFYLGTKDEKFGECLRESFSLNTIDVYWKKRYANLGIGTIGFNDLFSEYMLWGFELKKLCGYVKFYDKEGNAQYAEFITRVMDAKLHLEDKNCADSLKVNQEQEHPYGVETLFAQFLFSGAKNKKVDRYIPLEDIREVLLSELGDKCNVNELIDAYIEAENNQIKINLEAINASSDEFNKAVDQDSAEVFHQVMKQKREQLESFDIVEYEQLKFYKTGDTMPLGLLKSLGTIRKYLDSLFEKEKSRELMYKDAYHKCAWLVKQNKYILLRDRDWDKIFTNIEKYPESFERYYSVFRLDMSRKGISDICAAFLINDDLYAYSKELTDKFGADDASE